MTGKFTSVLEKAPANLGIYARLAEMQKLAMAEGWRWPEVSPVIDKTAEELREVREAIASGNRAEVVAELGDLIFMSTLLCHYMNIDPEEALQSVTEKFKGRFGYVERRAHETGRKLVDVPHHEERQWYNEFKSREKASA